MGVSEAFSFFSFLSLVSFLGEGFRKVRGGVFCPREGVAGGTCERGGAALAHVLPEAPRVYMYLSRIEHVQIMTRNLVLFKNLNYFINHEFF